MKEDLFFERDMYIVPNIGIYPPRNFPAHYHRHIELVVVTEGELYVNIDGNEELLSRGDAVFIFPYRIHSYRLPSEANRFITVFEPEFFGEFSRIFSECKPRNPIIKSNMIAECFHGNCGNTDFLQFFTDTFSEYCNSKIPIENDFHVFECDVMVKNSKSLVKLSEFISMLLEICEIEKSGGHDDGLYRKAVKYCCENFAECNLSVPDVAKAVNISVSRLQSIFTQSCGMGVKEHINFLRLTYAEKLLKKSNLSVTDIAMQSGFSSIRTFNRLFRKAKKLSPSEFKQLEH